MHEAVRMMWNEAGLICQGSIDERMEAALRLDPLARRLLVLLGNIQQYRALAQAQPQHFTAAIPKEPTR